MDARLRNLEQAAAKGDPDAIRLYDQQLIRSGQTPPKRGKEKLIMRCAYWGTWSRILKADYPFVEVDLTPINPHWHGRVRFDVWEKVRQINIRQHGTSRDKADEFHLELPDKMRAFMVDGLGEELTHRLLTEDFLSQIDWNKYDLPGVCNGGAPLSKILKEV